jgi:hypothetical protein
MPTNQNKPKVSARPETMREWKDRMDVLYRERHNEMQRQLNYIKSNCVFAVANADQPIRQFAQMILDVIEESL